MAKPSGSGAEVDARGEKLGRIEVAEILQRLLNAELVGQGSVGVREVIRVPRSGPQRVGREDERLRRKAQAGGASPTSRAARKVCKTSTVSESSDSSRSSPVLVPLSRLSPRRTT